MHVLCVVQRACEISIASAGMTRGMNGVAMARLLSTTIYCWIRQLGTQQSSFLRSKLSWMNLGFDQINWIAAADSTSW